MTNINISENNSSDKSNQKYSVYETSYPEDFVYYVGKSNRVFKNLAEELYTQVLFTGSEKECRELLIEINYN